MKPIILDSYYLISLHQDRHEPISVDRLTCLIYLLEGYYMVLENESALYVDSFKIDYCGIYVDALNDEFGERFDNICIDQEQIEKGKEICEERKKLIDDIFFTFEKFPDIKLRNVIRMGKNSPIEYIYVTPEVLNVYMYYSMSIPKNEIKSWFEKNYLQRR